MVKKHGSAMSPADKVKREKDFVLDCVAVGTLSSDSESYNPKLVTGIPPYNAQKDKTTKHYFKHENVKKILKKTGQVSDQLKMHIFQYQ